MPDSARLARLGRLCAIARLAGPGGDFATMDPIEELRELIEAELGIFLDAGAVVQLMGALTAVRFWAWAEREGRDPREVRIRRQRFFSFVVMAYESSTGTRAGLGWDRTDGYHKFGGKFFAMAQICSEMLPYELRPNGNSALGKVLDRALKRRTEDNTPRKSRGARSQSSWG